MAEIPDRLMTFISESARDEWVLDLTRLSDRNPTDPMESFIVGIAGGGGDILKRRIYYYANRWACLMEDALARGQSLAKIAKATRDEADPDGPAAVTLFMHTLATNMLWELWIHGDDLAAWWNVAVLGRDKGEAITLHGGLWDASVRVTPKGTEQIIQAYRDYRKETGRVP